MCSGRRLIGLVLIGLVLVTAAAAQDWPQFRGDGTGKVAGFTAPAAWPTALTQTWKALTGPTYNEKRKGAEVYAQGVKGRIWRIYREELRW